MLDGAEAVYHQYVVRLESREAARSALAAQGIATAVHYPIPLHRQPALAGVVAGNYPAAEMLAEEVLSLPMFPELSDSQLHEVVAALSAFVGDARTNVASAHA